MFKILLINYCILLIMKYFMWSVLCLSGVQIVLSQQEIGSQCHTSKGTEGICKSQNECLAIQNSTSKHDLFSETCHIETDGTPIVCCIVSTNQKESTTNKQESSTSNQDLSSSGTAVSQKEEESSIEARFFNGPRKRQYIPYKTSYKTPTSNLISNYEPIIYNDINPTTYQKKNQYNSQPNVNYNSFSYEPTVQKASQFSSSYDNVNSYNPSIPSNQNYKPYGSQSSNGQNYNTQGGQTNGQNYNQGSQSNGQNYNQGGQNYNTQGNQNYNPYGSQSNGQNYYQGSQSNSGYGNQNTNYNPSNRPTNRPNSNPVRPTTESGIVFKPTSRPNGNINFRPTSSTTNRPDLETNYWPTPSRPTSNQESHPVWGEVSESTSRTVRKPKPTEPSTSTSYRTNRPSTNLQQKRISEQKCNEYAKLVTQTVSAVPLSINPQVSSVEVQDCPNEAVELIVGGSKAVLGEFPHQAALGFRRGSSIEYSCGGTLISEEYILTAAHCIKSALGDPIHVRLGDLNLEKEDDGAQPQIIGVQQIIVNPGYKHPQLYNDIALIRMSRRVYFNKMLRPACLYPTHDVSTQRAIATGWGSTNYGETSSDDLLKVVLNIIDNKQCTSLYGTDTKLKNGITENMLCAGELSGKRDTCQGDSGGPLQITSPSHKCIHYVIGITSFGRSCGVPNSAGIYTRVSEYIDWIEGIVWRNA